MSEPQGNASVFAVRLDQLYRFLPATAKNTDLIAWLEEREPPETPVWLSHYRPGEIWTEEPFVCPACVHATAVQFAGDGDGGWYCKYCYTTWREAAGKLERRCPLFDDDGDEIGEQWL